MRTNCAEYTERVGLWLIVVGILLFVGFLLSGQDLFGGAIDHFSIYALGASAISLVAGGALYVNSSAKH